MLSPTKRELRVKVGQLIKPAVFDGRPLQITF
jgi:hypothetical protein